jgi:Rod binding domain-containing protein
VTQQSPDKVAKDFESVFASMMLKEMRKSLEPGSLFGDDSSDVYGGMFDQFMGQHMSESGGLGLASMIRQALEKSASLGQTTPTATPTPTVSAPTLK